MIEDVSFKEIDKVTSLKQFMKLVDVHDEQGIVDILKAGYKQLTRYRPIKEVTKK